ncbi:DUF5994 family protein [Streptomyces sp. BBFR109]|uniref:DUF5994 family protein n=1 Tax=Streptomyces sp. BBFR109 TaxID=3448172 RepID=UPI003F76709E
MDAITQPAGGTAPDDEHTYWMPPPRLRLTPDGSHSPLDGAWWPRCDALELELPVLVGALDPGLGTVTRVTVESAAWPGAPRKVMAPGHVIEVALTDADADAHSITVDCGTIGRWELLVVPPDEAAGAAALLLTAAADPGNPLPAPRLLALAENGPDRQATWESEQATWESEGGAGPGPGPR